MDIEVIYRMKEGILECRYELDGEQYGFEPYVGESAFEEVRDRVEARLLEFLPEGASITFATRTQENGKKYIAQEADTELSKSLGGGQAFSSLRSMNKTCDTLVRTSGFKELKTLRAK